MKRALTIVSGLLLCTGSAMAQAPAAQTITLPVAVQRGYAGVKLNLTEMATKMSEADYGFKPGAAPEMRTFGQLFAHIANAQYGTCAAAKGVANPNQGKNLETELKTKAEFVKALTDSFAFCDDAYAHCRIRTRSKWSSRARTPSRVRRCSPTTSRTTTRCTAPAPSTCAPRDGAAVDRAADHGPRRRSRRQMSPRLDARSGGSSRPIAVHSPRSSPPRLTLPHLP